MAKTMHICMISYKIPPLYSGASAQALRLAHALREKGVSVFALTARQTPDLPVRDTMREVPVQRLPVLRINGFETPSFLLTATWHLLCQYRRYDVVHVHGAYWRVASLLLVAKLLGKKTVVKLSMMGTDDPLTIRRRRFGSLLLRAVASADATVAISEELANSYLEARLPPERLIRIPNGVETNVFRPVGSDSRRALRAELGFPPDAPIVLFVGVVCWRKGVDRLLQAWSEVRQRCPNARLALVGPLGTSARQYGYPFGDYVQDFVAKKDRRARVRILGHQEHVERFYQMADVFVLPSRNEGLPNALLEAMACALPPVVTPFAGASELIENGRNGLLAPHDDFEALARSLVYLIGHRTKAERMGQAARRTVQARYSMDAISQRYVDLYISIMHRSNSPDTR